MKKVIPVVQDTSPIYLGIKCLTTVSNKVSFFSRCKIGLEVNAHKTKYMVMSWHQNAGRRHDIKIDNSSFERVEEFKYYGITLTYQNSNQEESKSRLKSGNACYHSVENLLSSSLLSKNLKILIHRTIILPIVLYGCATWLLTLREEHRLQVFENRMLRKIFGPKRDKVSGEWRKLYNEELNDLYSLPNTVWVIKCRMRWAEHVAWMGEGRGVYRNLVGKPGGQRPLGRCRCRWEDNIIMDARAWNGSMWLRIGTGGGHLGMQWWNFRFHKMQGISWIAQNRLNS